MSLLVGEVNDSGSQEALEREPFSTAVEVEATPKHPSFSNSSRSRSCSYGGDLPKIPKKGPRSSFQFEGHHRQRGEETRMTRRPSKTVCQGLDPDQIIFRNNDRNRASENSNGVLYSALTSATNAPEDDPSPRRVEA